MRSRYTAYVLGDVDHLRASWHPESRPARIPIDPTTEWLGLRIVDEVEGGPLDQTGEVAFRATYRSDDGVTALAERSEFSRVDGRWVYHRGQPGA